MHVTNECHEVMTRKQASEYLNVCLNTLDKLPIPRLQFGRTVRYKKSVLNEWLEFQCRANAQEVER